MARRIDYSALIFPVSREQIRDFQAQNVDARPPILTLEVAEATLRYQAFARANGMRFTPSVRGSDYPGMIFNVGHSRFVTNALRSTSGTFVEIGNVDFSEGVADESHSSWGFMALRLDRKLPHMVLDSLQNNGVFGFHWASATNLPGFLDKRQVLSLEGDFDKSFTLYCPREYERDALYIFTPDLMALLIDEAAPFDVEIIDDWLFVYSRDSFSAKRPQAYLRLFSIVDTVHGKVLKQSARYSDDRAGSFAANVVAPPGERLKPDVLATALDMRAASFGAEVVGSPGKLLERGALASALIGAAIVLAIPIIMAVTIWIFDR